MSVLCHEPPHKAQLIQVIFVPVSVGSGIESDPERLAYLYFSTDGNLLACYDTHYTQPEMPQHTKLVEAIAAAVATLGMTVTFHGGDAASGYRRGTSCVAAREVA